MFQLSSFYCILFWRRGLASEAGYRIVVCCHVLAAGIVCLDSVKIRKSYFKDREQPLAAHGFDTVVP